MKIMLGIPQCSSLYVCGIWKMPCISPFSILLWETLGKIQPLSTSKGFLFDRKPGPSSGLENLDILLCGMVWLFNIMVLFDFSHNVISFHGPWDALALSGVFYLPGQARGKFIRAMLIKNSIYSWRLFSAHSQNCIWYSHKKLKPGDIINLFSSSWTSSMLYKMKKQLLTDDGCFLF